MRVGVLRCSLLHAPCESRFLGHFRDVRSVAPVKAPSVALRDTPGVAYSSDLGDGPATSSAATEEDDADEEAAAVYHSSFNCGGGMALCRTTSSWPGEYVVPHSVSQHSADTEQAKNKPGAFCSSATLAAYAALPQECASAVRECAFGDSKELTLLTEEEREFAADSFSSDQSKTERCNEWKVGSTVHAGAESSGKGGAGDEGRGADPAIAPKIVVRFGTEASQKRSKREILLQLDADAYEAHGYEVANAVTAAKYPRATIGVVR